MEDALTGVYDRKTFFSLLRRQVSIAAASEASVGLLIIDIEDFTRHNNVLGYERGDLILIRFARVLRSVARSFDYVARIGDDRFALILPSLKNLGHAELAVHKLHRLLEVPLEVGDSKVRIFTTVGLALCPQHATYSENLLKEAERALLIARRMRQPFFVSRAQEVNEDAELWDLEMDLRSAIRSDQFVLHYQPKVSFKTLRPVGAEALIRWNSPARGQVPPNRFLPIAQEAGMLKDITAWVLNTALRQAADWPEQWGPLSVSVNVPPTIVTLPDFPDILNSALRLWRADGTILVVEITEDALASDPDRLVGILGEIEELGVKISIDDFGTGYSSLAYFKNLPASELKIDRSFVRGLLSNRADNDIVHLIIEIAHRFDLEVVAEGIEDVETFKKLRSIGCDIAQGYLLGKPMPHSDLIDYLTRSRNKASASES
jgi:diguanylate cyclase (GGDEF)-like protein